MTATVAGAYQGVSLNIGVTGHRYLSDDCLADLPDRLRSFFSELRSAFPELPLKVISPLATGADSIAAEIGLEMGIELIVPLPMPTEAYETDFSDTELETFRRLKAHGTAFELPLAPGNTNASIAVSGTQRNRQYAQLGAFVSSHCQILLALWDGHYSDDVGGTGSVVRFHLNDNIPDGIEGIPDINLLVEKENDLIYHIPCERPEQPTTGVRGGWLNRNGYFDGESLPARYRAAFNQMRDFGRDVERFADRINPAADALECTSAPPYSTGPQLIDAVFGSSDWLAIRFRTLVVRQLAVTHLAAALMGIAFILFSDYEFFDFLLPIFLTLFFGAWALNRLANRREWHRKYLDYRTLAEGLRVQYYWTLAGVEDLRGAALAYDNLMQKQDVEVVWIRHVIRNVSVHSRSLPRGPEDGLQLTINNWVGSLLNDTGQLGYFKRAAFRHERDLRRTELWGRSTLIVGISIAVGMLFAGNAIQEDLMTILIVLIGILPLVAAVREAYAYKKADRELAKQYQFMLSTFSRAGRLLEEAIDSETKCAVLRALGETCLQEHAEWILLHRERPLEQPALQT